ncbi:MAG: TIGR02186 family protein [Paracoccaceae bacterium]
MMGRLLLFFVLAMPLRADAQPEEVVAALSQARVSITANFSGSEILVFGAVKRSAPEPEGPPLQVIVTIAGPREPITVRRKSREFGIWVNTEAVDVDAAPTFYAVAATVPLADAISNTEDLRYKVSIQRMIRSVGAPPTVRNSEAFTQALIRLRVKDGHYTIHEGGVSLSEGTLFRSSIALPANLTEGEYTARIFLTRGGQVIDSHTTGLDVTMVGLERWTFNLAHQRPLIYGILSIFIAIAAGWGASAVFRYIRG